MTDTFIQSEDNADQNTDQNFQQQQDQAKEGGDKSVDTHSPEYQVQVMQQRLKDKDDFIETLKGESQQVRDQYSDLAERMNNMEKISEVLKDKGAEQQDVDNQNTNLDEDALVGKVIENLNKKQTESKMKENYNNVVSRLSNEFGEQYIETKVQEAADKAGLNVSDMVETARKSPTAFYKLMSLETKSGSSPQPTQGSQIAPRENSNDRGFEHFNNLRRTNPREYWKPEVQREYRKLFEFNKQGS